jgi:hypothetical protein
VHKKCTLKLTCPLFAIFKPKNNFSFFFAILFTFGLIQEGSILRSGAAFVPILHFVCVCAIRESSSAQASADEWCQRRSLNRRFSPCEAETRFSAATDPSHVTSLICRGSRIKIILIEVYNYNNSSNNYLVHFSYFDEIKLGL